MTNAENVRAGWERVNGYDGGRVRGTGGMGGSRAGGRPVRMMGGLFVRRTPQVALGRVD
ncbi:hypothetical protein [Streptomyces sp. NPDC003247]|uniref:hypothetical protein n=1 Tax=Streptomyces sp. NPDC003247 TaxID=3364677 RepID=UPI0036962D97